MPTRYVVLTDQQAEMIEVPVKSGRYQNSSDVVRDGLRLLQTRVSEGEARLAALRHALDEAEQAVEAGAAYDFNDSLLDADGA